jgi:hypothetical protein
VKHRYRDCNCNHKITDFDLIEFKINDSRIDLQCIECNGLMGWWHRHSEKIMPLKRKWSQLEREEMRKD